LPTRLAAEATALAVLVRLPALVLLPFLATCHSTDATCIRG
jgi:hypothetical protein